MVRRLLQVLALIPLFVPLAPVVTAEDNRGGLGEKMLKKLEGTWVLVSGEQDGKPLSQELVAKSRLIIKGNHHTVQLGGDTLMGTHTIDPVRRPRTIDSTDTAGPFQGQTLRGIYELKGDTFRVCFAAPGKERPTEFTTKMGTGHILHVWKRQGAGQK
jgi:uncharacterized protein (TIGR03067 family)